MKLIKRIGCLLISAVLTLPLLAGCAGNEPQGDLAAIMQGNSANSTVISQTPSGNDPSVVQPSVTEPSAVLPSTVEQSSSPVPNTSTVTPAMWKVEDNQGHVCYMFGTIHAADDEAINLPAYFEDAYKECEAIAVEIDISTVMSDPAQMQEVVKYLTYSDGTKIQDHISKEVYDGICTVMKNNSAGYVDHMYDTLTPSAWSSLLESAIMQKCGMESDKGVDITLINRAKSEGKTVLEVESMEYQLQMFSRMTDTIGELMLINYATQEGFDSQVQELKELFAKWKQGTPVMDDVDTSQLALLDKETREAMEYYLEEMFGKRNPAMAEKVDGYMKEGKKVLVMVGAAHFYGENGLVNLMRQKGYTVTRISPPATTDTQVIGAV